MPLHQTRFDGGATAEQLNCSAKTPRGQRLLTPFGDQALRGIFGKAKFSAARGKHPTYNSFHHSVVPLSRCDSVTLRL